MFSLLPQSRGLVTNWEVSKKKQVICLFSHFVTKTKKTKTRAICTTWGHLSCGGSEYMKVCIPDSFALVSGFPDGSLTPCWVPKQFTDYLDRHRAKMSHLCDPPVCTTKPKIKHNQIKLDLQATPVKIQHFAHEHNMQCPQPRLEPRLELLIQNLAI